MEGASGSVDGRPWRWILIAGGRYLVACVEANPRDVIMIQHNRTVQIKMLRKLGFPLVLLSGLIAGCRTIDKAPLPEAQREALALLLPNEIEIIKPFTKVASFDDDPEPEGIELFVRAVNYLENPGLMLVGAMRIEMYEYVPASADHKGKQLDLWEVPLRTREDQRKHWNQLTQMYEFRLDVNQDRLPVSQRVVLLVTYISPFGDKKSAEHILRFDNLLKEMRSRGLTG